MPDDRWELRRLRLWDGQEIDLNLHDLVLGATKATNGLAVYLYLKRKGHKGQHVTIICANGRLTVHSTDEQTQERKTLIAFDLNWAVELTRPGSSFLAVLRSRLSRSLYHISRPEHLESVGARRLLPFPVTQAPHDAQDDVLDVSSLAPVSISSAWQADAGSCWGVLAVDDVVLGILFSGWFGGYHDILFFPWHQMVEIMRWFVTELAGPTGRVPDDFLVDLL